MKAPENRCKHRPARLLIAYLCLAMTSFSFVYAPAIQERHDLATWVKDLFSRRSALLITGEARILDGFYGDNRGGIKARAHELFRSACLVTWLKTHHARLLSVKPDLRLLHIEKGREQTIYVTVSTLFSYCYPQAKKAAYTLAGYTTYHVMSIVKNGSRWQITYEWYEDPLCAHVYQTRNGSADLQIEPVAVAPSSSDLRIAAVAYADRFCGVTVPRISNGRYNQKYPDLSMKGGDCANYASQVLTDPGAGRMGQDWGWWSGRRGATVTWTRADAMVGHLLYTGRASLMAKGNLEQLQAGGDLARLLPGDIIAYQEKGVICHVAVVAGHDDRGWPLVDCHTADRYRNPFDLGWGPQIKYWLLRTAID